MRCDKLFYLIFVIIVTAVIVYSPAESAEAWVELGNINVEHGLSCPNAGDGQNTAAVVDGRECRSNDTDIDPKSGFLYFDVDPEVIRSPKRPVYVTVEYYDLGYGSFQIQYDSQDHAASEDGACKDGPGELMLDSKKWRSVTLELADARFDGRMANNADFRLVCAGSLNVAKVTVSTIKPDGYDSGSAAIRDRIESGIGGVSPAAGIRVIVGDFAARDAVSLEKHLKRTAPILKAMGATSVRTPLSWNEVEPSKGSWTWQHYDNIVEILKANGLKWVPEMTASSSCRVPDWFFKSADSVPAVCADHSKAGPYESMWNPRMSKWIGYFISEFGSHYRNCSTLDSIAVSISRDPDPADGPHAHSGMWCGDEYAIKDFKRYLGGKYSKPARLNAAWKTAYRNIDQLTMFSPDTAPSDDARADLEEWYRTRTLRTTETWVKAIRETLPSVQVFIRADVDPEGEPSPDFAALARTASRQNAGIWVVSNAVEYKTAFAATDQASTASKFYGTPCALGTTGSVRGADQLVHLFNCASSAAWTVGQTEANMVLSPDNLNFWKSGLSKLAAKTPVVHTAVFCPGPATAESYGAVAAMRDGFDFDVINERLIIDGALDHYTSLIWTGSDAVSEKALAALMNWLRTGGTLIAAGSERIRQSEKNIDISESILPEPGNETVSRTIGAGVGIRVPGDWTKPDETVRNMSRVLNGLSVRAGRSIAPDGEVDQVYVTDLGGRLLVFNTADKQVERQMEIGIGQRIKVSIPARSIVEIPLTAGNQEVL